MDIGQAKRDRNCDMSDSRGDSKSIQYCLLDWLCTMTESESRMILMFGLSHFLRKEIFQEEQSPLICPYIKSVSVRDTF